MFIILITTSHRQAILLNQLNPVHTLPTYIPNIEFNSIFLSMPSSSKSSLSFRFSKQILQTFHISQWYMPRPSQTLWFGHLIIRYLLNSVNHEALQYETAYSHPSLHPSEVHTISSASCSKRPSICVLPWRWETKFHSHAKQQVKL
jgi:hypothetical protein